MGKVRGEGLGDGTRGVESESNRRVLGTPTPVVLPKGYNAREMGK